MASEQGLQHWCVKSFHCARRPGPVLAPGNEARRHRTHKASLVFFMHQVRLLDPSIHSAIETPSLVTDFFAGQWVQSYGAPLKACLNTTYHRTADPLFRMPHTSSCG